MMHVGHTSHKDEWEVVQKPAHQWVETRIMDLVRISQGFKVLEATLPTQDIDTSDEHDAQERRGATPVDKGISEKEILDSVVVPRAHAKTNIKDGPLPELGGEIVLLVRIGDKGVIGGHHGDVEMDKVAKER
jgi:hypothetical protein